MSGVKNKCVINVLHLTVKILDFFATASHHNCLSAAPIMNFNFGKPSRSEKNMQQTHDVHLSELQVREEAAASRHIGTDRGLWVDRQRTECPPGLS